MADLLLITNSLHFVWVLTVEPATVVNLAFRTTVLLVLSPFQSKSFNGNQFSIEK